MGIGLWRENGQVILGGGRIPLANLVVGLVFSSQEQTQLAILEEYMVRPPLLEKSRNFQYFVTGLESLFVRAPHIRSVFKGLLVRKGRIRP